jgi:patatin-like phospholipase/acyl hydrolase
MKKKFKILSLDGGGLRGLAELIILKRIEDITGKKIHELFDLIVGTSTGGIIACGLTASRNGKTILTVDKLIDLYHANGTKIFPKQDTWLKKKYRGIRSIFLPKYKKNGLEDQLLEYFGDIRLSEVIKPVIITSYDIIHNEIIMFKSRRTNEYGLDLPLKDVCRATSAAPVYLSPFEFNYNNVDRVLVDGGIYINNPAMAAVADTLRYKYGNPDISVEDIQLLSLGTGFHSEKLGYKRKWWHRPIKKWGALNWAVPISTVMLQASAKCVEYECGQLPLDKFLRLQFMIDEEDRSEMDDSREETLRYIINCVNDQILNKHLDEIKDFFK